MALLASWIFIIAFMVESCLCSGKSENGETKWGKDDKKKTEVFPEFYDNYQITGPRLSSSETASALVCIHKCQRHNLCNVVNIRQKSGSRVECVLASFGSCFYGSERKLQKSNGWQLYFLHEKNCDNVKAHGSSSTPRITTAKPTQQTTTEATTTTATSGSGSFYLKHKQSGKCLAYDDTMDRLVLRNPPCQQSFSEVAGTKYLRHQNEKCMLAVGQELTLSADCTSNSAAFKFNVGRQLILRTDNNNQEKCLWHNNPVHNSKVQIRGGCGTESKLYFTKTMK